MKKSIELQGVPLADLRAELHRREEEERTRRAQIREKQLEDLNSLTLEAVNGLAPEHGRTSCSDDNLANGFLSDGIPRCNRCALLELINQHPMPEGLSLCVTFDFY